MSQVETAAGIGDDQSQRLDNRAEGQRKVERARETLRAYESTMTSHIVAIEVRSRPSDIPTRVLREGDRFGIRIQSNLVEIIGIVKSLRPSVLRAVGRRVR